MRIAAVTHRGLQRTENQDRIVIDGYVLASGNSAAVEFDLGPCCLVAVVDGMGGHAAGGIAAAIVADVMASGHRRLNTAADVEMLVSEANDELYTLMQRITGLGGMGATIAGVLVTSSALIIFNVGDARVYLAAGGHLIQVSIDDRHPGLAWGGVTQSLGGLRAHTRVDVHVISEPKDPGKVLVASDGLFGGVTREVMTRAVRARPAKAARILLEEAIAAGGTDNISLVVLDLPATIANGPTPNDPATNAPATTPYSPPCPT